jgi:ABC-2 type transport system ATP-binding protein
MDDAINLDRVFKKLGQREVLRGVSFTVQKGDIFGYLGPNGAGKTTTIRVILGLMEATSGKASILGRSVQEDNIRQKIGFVLEVDGLYDNLTAYDNLQYYSQIYEVSGAPARIDRAIKLVGLADRANDKVGNYSKGMRQRLALARAVVHNPELLVLDEPTAGVDPTGQIEIRQIMLDMVNKEGKTILLSSHNLDEVQRICNRIALIDQGEIKLYGELEKLQREMSHGEVVIETADPVPDITIRELITIPGIDVQGQREKVLTLATGKDTDVSGIVALLSSRGVRIEQVRKQQATLEEIYTTILKEAEQK